MDALIKIISKHKLLFSVIIIIIIAVILNLLVSRGLGISGGVIGIILTVVNTFKARKENERLKKIDEYEKEIRKKQDELFTIEGRYVLHEEELKIIEEKVEKHKIEKDKIKDRLKRMTIKELIAYSDKTSKEGLNGN